MLKTDLQHMKIFLPVFSVDTYDNNHKGLCLLSSFSCMFALKKNNSEKI